VQVNSFSEFAVGTDPCVPMTAGALLRLRDQRGVARLVRVHGPPPDGEPGVVVSGQGQDVPGGARHEEFIPKMCGTPPGALPRTQLR